MSWAGGLLLVGAIGFVLLVAGYWVAAFMQNETAGERMAAASLTGLCMLTLGVSVVNLFHPIDGKSGLVCLLPCAVSLVTPAIRRKFMGDLRQITALRGTYGTMFGVIALLALILYPLWSDSNVVFYDGNSNHDNFFWIAGAEHVKAHSYLKGPAPASVFTSSAAAMAGWYPAWGRMATEGLLALVSAVTRLPPIYVYNWAIAALLFPWLAGVYLILRTFITERPSLLVLAIAAFLQPLFVFFFGYGSVPNLLGALAGAAMVIGIQRHLKGAQSEAVSWPWFILVALATHALLCAYPEMFPFVLLPCALLCLRAWVGHGWRAAWLSGAALLSGILLNPVTLIRGINGFIVSFRTARLDKNWTNYMEPLNPAEYLPALTTLDVRGCDRLGWLMGGVLSLLLLGAFIFMVRRARDPFGTAAMLSGAILLLLYTLLTDFSYGWQKTVQFGGISIAAIFPAGCLAVLEQRASITLTWITSRLAAVTLLAFFSYATVDSCVRTYTSARRKHISRDMLALRAESRTRLRDVPVLIVSDSFYKSFFYGMWSSYLFPESNLIFSARNDETGGYLRKLVQKEPAGMMPAPAAVFVSHEWAETFDANSRRLIDGGDFALLEKSNRVFAEDGFFPPDGVPQFLATRANLKILPHRDSWMQMTLHARDASMEKNVQLRASHRLEGESQPSNPLVFGGASPWHVTLPLKGGIVNLVALEFSGPAIRGERPFSVDVLRVTDEP